MNKAKSPKKLPLVSVIVPTRNRCIMLLPRALDSILGQSYTNLEVVVIDDASEDGTQAVVKKYAEKFGALRYIRNEQRKGGAESRNIGIANSSGAYMAFLDDDDEWLPEKISRQVGFLEENPNIGAVSCWFNRVLPAEVRKARLIPEISLDLMLWENFLGSFSLCMVRSEIAKAVKIDLNLACGQDWQFWIELFKITGVGIVEEYLVNYHEHSGNRIGGNHSNMLAGVRRIYFMYRDEMSYDCRVYLLTKLVFYRALISKQGLIGLVIQMAAKIAKTPFVFKNRSARFVLKKMAVRYLHIIFRKDSHDTDAANWMTYRHYMKIKECAA